MKEIIQLIKEGYGDDILLTPNQVISAITPRPIESASRDGTHILLYGEHEDDLGCQNVGWCEGYVNGLHGWYHVAGRPCEPTHWLPLPPVDATPENPEH